MIKLCLIACVALMSEVAVATTDVTSDEKRVQDRLETYQWSKPVEPACSTQRYFKRPMYAFWLKGRKLVYGDPCKLMTGEE